MSEIEAEEVQGRNSYYERRDSNGERAILKWILGIVSTLLVAAILGAWQLSIQVAQLTTRISYLETRLSSVESRVEQLQRRGESSYRRGEGNAN